MKAAGYRYPNPLAPATDRTLLGRGLPVPPGDTLAPPSPIEKKVAITDMTCKQKIGYLRSYAQATAFYQRQLISENAQRLHQVMREWGQVMRNAARL